MPARTPWRPRPSWGSAFDYALIVVSALVAALNVALFLAPHKIAPGGVSGIAILVRYMQEMTDARLGNSAR